MMEVLTKCLHKFHQVVLQFEQLSACFLKTLGFFLQLPLQLRRNLVALPVTRQLFTLRLQTSQLLHSVVVENDVFGTLLQQQVLEVEQTSALSLHLTRQAPHQTQVFLSLHEQTQVAVSVQRFEVLRLQFEVFELLQQFRVVFQAVQRPRHLCFDPLIQLLLLVGVLDAFLFDEPLAYLNVSLSLFQVACLRGKFLLLFMPRETEFFAEELHRRFLLENLRIDSISLTMGIKLLFVVILEQLAGVGATLEESFKSSKFGIELHVKLQVVQLESVDPRDLRRQRFLCLVQLLTLPAQLITMDLEHLTQVCQLRA